MVTSFPEIFFQALDKGDGDEAIDTLKSGAFSNGTPSPRTAELIASGEWDALQKLSLVYIDETHCTGRVGNDQQRFCGKSKGSCSFASHNTNTVPDLKRGWYIGLAGKNSGLFASPYLPAEEDGGPITSRAAAYLMDPESGFALTKGQWLFIIETWELTRSWELSETEMQQTALPRHPQPTLDARKPPFVVEYTKIGGVEETKDHVVQTEPVQPPPKMSARAMLSTLLNPSPIPFKHLSPPLLTEIDMDEGSESTSTLPEAQAIRVEMENASRNFRALLKQQVDQLRAELRAESLQAWTATQTRADQALARTAQMEQELRLVNQQNREMRTMIEHTLQAGTAGQSHGETNWTTGHASTLARLEHAVLSPQGAFESLKLRFTQFKDKFESGGGIECHGVKFNSKKEFLQWFEDRDLSVECFLDGMAYLHSITPAVVHMEDAAKLRDLENKNSMKSTLQLSVETSFDTTIPSVLIGGKKTSEEGGSVYGWLLSHLKTFDVWKPKGVDNGVANQITDGIPLVTDRISDVRDDKTEDRDAVVLSTGLCHDSARFCTELVRFMTDQYEDLAQHTTYTHKQIWTLQLECLQVIITELRQARGSVIDAACRRPGYYVWGMLRAWKVQKRYLENHFKNDPALTGLMVRRILLQGNDTGIIEKLKDLEALRRKVEEHIRIEEEHHRNQVGEVKKLKELVAAKK